MQRRGKSGVIRNQRPRLAGKRRVDFIKQRKGLRQLDDKLRCRQPLALLIAGDLLRQFRRDFRLLKPLAKVIAPARKIVRHRLFKLWKFFKKRRQLRRRQKGNDYFFDQPLLADGQHDVKRIQR